GDRRRLRPGRRLRQPADRLRQRVHRPEDPLLMAAPAGTTRSVPQRSRLLGVRRVVAPIREARGFARVMLYIGAAITVFFVLVALLAPVISPYAFDQYTSGGHRFPQLAGPSSKH